MSGELSKTMRRRTSVSGICGGLWMLAVVVGSVGCQVSRMLPEGSVLDERRRQSIWAEPGPSDAEYISKPRAGTVPISFPVFGIPYDLDIVLVSSHPKWEMHEYARIRTPDGPIWIAKDTRSRDGDQLLVTDSSYLREGAPEIPLVQTSHPLRVDNRSRGNWLDLEFRYRNVDGERVRVQYEGPKPRPVAKRNGSTMGHSRNQVLAVLDLSHRSFGRRAAISIGGKSYGVQRLLGVRPLRLAIRQVQGGIPDATYTVSESESGFQTRFRRPGAPVRVAWDVESGEDAVVVRQRSRLRTLEYRYRRGPGSALELVEAGVQFWNDEEPTFRVRFAPALPDPRRRFRGVERSRWVMDVGRRRNHAVGTVRVRSTDSGAALQFEGDAPWWVAERCVGVSLTMPSSGGIRVVSDAHPCEEGR